MSGSKYKPAPLATLPSTLDPAEYDVSPETPKSAGRALERIGHVSKSVKGKASLPCGYTFSAKELTKLRVYWQKDDKAVLSYTPEEREVWPQYKNRTVLDIPNNFSLMIMPLFLSDRGKYTCVIQMSDGGPYKRKHLASVNLTVRADYPVPNITELGNPSADIKRIMCITSGGFPKPHLSWLENGTELSGINTTISQDPESELYTVSSKLDFNMTYNHSIVCHVVYGDSQVSKNFTWEKHKEHYTGKCLLYYTTI
ncbi:T-lymphocyte activation antigen CD80 [Onychomys torridus]|uniref:T-lymphocyte activation antigen CD80 n=1 Tax=Onychomys torridus TaxID=38674 RepID=UPI00167FB097|nr:T-lymphocyte activation antigen CD80 [Onychomys torridus]